MLPGVRAISWLSGPGRPNKELKTNVNRRGPAMTNSKSRDDHTTFGAAGEAEVAVQMSPPKATAKGARGVRLTYLGGPTYLIEIGRFRIVTDPGFDPQGTFCRSCFPGPHKPE